MARYRTFTSEFNAQVVLEQLSGTKSAAELCPKHHLKDSLPYRWKQGFMNDAAKNFQHQSLQQHAEVRDDGVNWSPRVRSDRARPKTAKTGAGSSSGLPR